ncbi:ATP-binding protein, partial [Candidatus Woesearchaeota archaeon]|nr:ATP-binding protein [Candidatus Woesearchaeota archaeon]
KKIIITGGPCVGKTTTISLLKEKGIHVIDEVPRDIIAAELKKKEQNSSYEPIVPWTKFEEFQHLIIEEQLKRESLIPVGTHTVLLDRSLVDILGYCKVANKHPPEQLMAHIKKASYTKVIFLDQLPKYETDAVRKEDADMAKKIHDTILGAYKELGFEIVVVSPHDKKIRAEFVRKHL